MSNKKTETLNLRDRLKMLWRTIRILFDPNVDYINVIWQTKTETIPKSTPVYNPIDKKTIYTHTFFTDNLNPSQTLTNYMAIVAAKSESLDDLNKRCEYYLERVACANMLLYPKKGFELRYMGNPIQEVKLENSLN